MLIECLVRFLQHRGLNLAFVIWRQVGHTEDQARLWSSSARLVL